MLSPSAVAAFVVDVACEVLASEKLRDAARDFATAVAPVETAKPELLTRAELARRLRVSIAHVTRLDPPGVCVGDTSTKRFDLEAVREWLRTREPKPTTPPVRKSDVDVTSALAAAGLRRSA